MKFKNYRNSYNNSNRIYSNKEVRNMRLSEIAKIQDELRAQYKAIGVPTSEALRASSNVIWIDEYTKDDGTKVSGHWRSLPDGRSDEFLDGNTVLAEKNNSLKDSEMSEYIKQENEKAVLRKDPERIAGVKRGTPMSFEEAASEKINPAYFQDDYQKRIYK